MTFNKGCVNPKSRNFGCALDSPSQPHGKVLESFKVVKVRGNRSYLCRWAMKADLSMKQELHDVFGIYSHAWEADVASSSLKRPVRGLSGTEDTDLYEIGGCLLRLGLWPTERLWTELDNWLEMQGFDSLYQGYQGSTSTSSSSASDAGGTGKRRRRSLSKNTEKADDNRKTKPLFQIGMHFRCGDSSFTLPADGTDTGKVRRRNPECWYDPKQQWNGTAFYDDLSMDSPVDEANCVQKLLHGTADNKDDIAGDANKSVKNPVDPWALVYIASDNGDSAQQVSLRKVFTVIYLAIAIIPLIMKTITPDDGSHIGMYIYMCVYIYR